MGPEDQEARASRQAPHGKDQPDLGALQVQLDQVIQDFLWRRERPPLLEDLAVPEDQPPLWGPELHAHRVRRARQLRP